MSRAKTVSKTRARVDKAPNPKAVPKTGAFLSGRNLNIVLSALLAALTIALYSPVIGYPFLVLDDTDYVTSNLHVHGGLSWSTIKWAFTAFTAANWHPLTWLSHTLDYQLFALNPAGHHFDSVLIHALNVVLLFLVLQWLTARVGPSLLVAALFAWHPIRFRARWFLPERLGDQRGEFDQYEQCYGCAQFRAGVPEKRNHRHGSGKWGCVGRAVRADYQ